MKRLIAVIVIAMMVMSLAGCGSKQDPLVGKWIEDVEPAGTLELFSDGTGILTTSAGNAYTITSWLAENGRLKLTTQMPFIGESTFVFDYEISGKVLTVMVEDGSSTYTKED